jgi:uncharacterized delta-60 repeat protein
LQATGALDPSFSVYTNETVLDIALQGDSSIVFGGLFTQVNSQTRNRVARVSADGVLEANFSIAADNNVYALSVLATKHIAAGGSFTQLGGQAAIGVGRITPTTTVDAAFAPTVSGVVYSLLPVDANLLVGGAFTAVNGVGLTNLARLLPNATLDNSFTPNPAGAVYDMLRQPDQRLLIAGDFTQIVGANQPRLARLYPDGTLDPTFAPNPSATVRTIAQQPDGRLLVGGAFTTIAGQSATRLARLSADGAFDASFTASAAGGDVYAVLVQPDGKIVIGGAFTQINGQPRPYLARLEANGALDASFAPAMGGAVYTLGLQPDGRLLVGGAFTSVSVSGAPVVRNRIARFGADGALDVNWDPNANDTVYAIALQPDGKVLIGGAFTTVGGQPHGRIARLSSDLAATQKLTVPNDGDSILWTQTGAGPELAAVYFYSSTDAVNYTALGNGVRIDAGWTITNVAIPLSQTVWVKAYGEYAGGQSNGSTSTYESMRMVLIRAADVTIAAQVVGGTAQASNWTYTISNKQLVGNGTLRIDAGVYTIGYAGPVGYTLTSAGSACSLASGVITLNAALGANACSLTFTRDTGSITFVKAVEGGAAQASAFSFAVGGQSANHNQALTLETGVYTVTESGPAGYQVRTAAGVCTLVDGAIRLTVTKTGGTCTVTNAWPITVTKQVSGGQAVPTDWSFTVNGQAVASGGQVVLPPGKYAVTESGPDGYSLYSAAGNCAIEAGVVQLTAPATPGGAGACTITNRRDTGTITFIKTVEGGAAQPSAFSFNVLTRTVAHNGQAVLETGVYTMTESGPTGYTLRQVTGACALVNGAIQLTVTKAGGTCTVVNTWPVTFAKIVEGGSATGAEWAFTVDGRTISSTAQMLLAPGVYTVTESGPARYSLVATGGDCALVNGAARLTVPASTGSTGSCTLTNRRDSGAITFRTTVEGDGAVAANFTYTVIGQSANGDGGQMTLPTEDYTVSISGPTGFIPRLAGGVCTLVDGMVRLAVNKAGGECALTMTLPVKFVSVVDGGTRPPASWSLRVGDSVVFHNRTVLLAPGIYTPTLQGAISTYTMVEARGACSLDALGQGITLVAPGSGVCTIVNRRNTGDVIFRRVVQGGSAQSEDWVTLVNGQSMPLNTLVTLPTNTYIVTESGPPDYVVTAASGICALDRGQIKLTVTEEGGECGLVSTRGVGPVGFVMFPGGGTSQADEWSFVVNGQVVPHNGALLMPVGLYSVTVRGPAGYTVIAASGICSLTEAGNVQLSVSVDGGTCNLQSAYGAGGVGAISFFAVPSDDAPPEAWAFVVNGEEVDHSQTKLMSIGTYSVTVNGPAGYHVANATGACALTDGVVRLTVTVFGGSCTVQTAPDIPAELPNSLFMPVIRQQE